MDRQREAAGLSNWGQDDPDQAGGPGSHAAACPPAVDGAGHAPARAIAASGTRVRPRAPQPAGAGETSEIAPANPRGPSGAQHRAVDLGRSGPHGEGRRVLVWTGVMPSSWMPRWQLSGT